MPVTERVSTTAHPLIIQWLILGLALLVLGGAVGYSITHEFNRINALEQERLTAQAKVVDANLQHQLLALNLALLSIRSDLPYWKTQRHSDTLVNLHLKTVSDSMPGVRTLIITNAEGMVFASNRRELLGLNFRDREYFQTARRGLNPAMLYISPPFKTVLGVYSMNVVMVVLDTRGAFTGIISATLDPEYFSVLLNSVLYSPGMRASLIHGDGKVFVEVPDRKDLSGMDLAKPGSRYTLHVNSGRTADLFASGRAYSTGDDRMSAWRTVRPRSLLMDRPLMISVNRDMHGIFASWRSEAFRQGGLFGVLALAAVFGLSFYQRRQQKFDHYAAIFADELKKSEENYRSLFQNASIGIFHSLPEGKFLRVNPALAQMLGYGSPEEMVSVITNISTQIYIDSKKHSKLLAATSEQTGWVYAENRYRRKDGTILTANLAVRKVLNTGNTVAYLEGFVEDITERKRAEESLRQSEENARRLDQENAVMAEIGRIVSSTLNVDEVYEAFAIQVRKVLSFDRIVISIISPDQITTRNVYIAGEGILDRNFEDAYPLKGSGHAEMLRTKSTFLIQTEDFCEYEDRFPGLWSTFQAGFRSIMNVPLFSKGELIGALLLRSRKLPAYSGADVRLAERIGAQIAGSIANAQLFNDLGKAIKSLRENEERLHRAEKLEALGHLAGGVAHDLNNVLGVSSVYAELLQEKVPEESPLRKYVDNIFLSAQKGAAIIEDLLTLARRGVTVSEVMNLTDIVATFLKTPVFEKIQAYHPNVTFRTECQEELLNIQGSPLHLEKTLMNLVSNAAEAISGQGEVTIQTENRYLDKPIRGYDEVKEGDYAVLTVSDTGKGIPAENIGKIFEPFYTKKTMGRSGTGLGLAIVWGTVKDHHGYIDLHTEIGEGTAFTLYFPVTREGLVDKQKKIPIEQYMGNGESVLVVDDIAEQRDVASRLLTRLRYEVQAVSSGEEAVEYLKENNADILVLDMIMTPGIDGLETYQKILEINPTQKAILVSGFSETDRVKGAQKLGAGTYVKKPYIMEKIGVAIRAELARQ